MPCGKKRKKRKMNTHKRKKRLRANRHKKKKYKRQKTNIKYKMSMSGQISRSCENLEYLVRSQKVF